MLKRTAGTLDGLVQMSLSLRVRIQPIAVSFQAFFKAAVEADTVALQCKTCTYGLASICLHACALVLGTSTSTGTSHVPLSTI